MFNQVMIKQGIFTGAICAVAALATAVPAAGAQPAISVGIGRVTGGAHESALQLGVTGSRRADEISVTLDATKSKFVITSTRPINPPPPPCVQLSSSRVQCPKSQFVSFSASLAAGNDAFTVGPSVMVPVSLGGGPGKDSLSGGSGSDTLTGGAGGDRLTGRNGKDTLRGGKGSDVSAGGKERDTLIGGSGADVLRGGAGRDLLRGGPGADVLRGGPGRDVSKQ